MATRLRKLKLRELSLVDRPANQHARVVLYKRADPALSQLHETLAKLDERVQKFARSNNIGPSPRLLALKRRVDALVGKAGSFDESKHPRKPKGDADGGQFSSAAAGGGTFGTIRTERGPMRAYIPSKNEAYESAGDTRAIERLGNGRLNARHAATLGVYVHSSSLPLPRAGEDRDFYSNANGDKLYGRVQSVSDSHVTFRPHKEEGGLGRPQRFRLLVEKLAPLENALSSVREVLNKAGKGNPYHKPKGKGGGQFTSGPGGGSGSLKNNPYVHADSGKVVANPDDPTSYDTIYRRKQNEVLSYLEGAGWDFAGPTGGGGERGEAWMDNAAYHNMGVRTFEDGSWELHSRSGTVGKPLASGSGISSLGRALKDRSRRNLAKAQSSLDDALSTVRSVLGKRDFSGKQRERLAGTGAAMPDGSFPISTVSDLHNAVRAIGRAKNPAAAKVHIKRRAKALGATDALPDSWK